MSTNLPLNLLSEMAVFVRVVETGSFSAAARSLGSTPSAVSRSVARLEKALGLPLLQRSTRKLRLNDQGEAALKGCQDMLNAARSVFDLGVQSGQTAAGKIRISVPKAVGHYVIHPHIPEFLRRYPQIDIQMLLADRYVDLIDEQFDIALRITDSPSPGLMGRQLMSIEHLICATPRYLAEHGAPQHPQDLRNHSCIGLGEMPADARWTFRQGNKTSHIMITGRYAANHTGVRLDAVRQGMGIGSLPYFTAQQALNSGEIVQVLPEWQFINQYRGGLWLLYSPTRHLPARLRVFIEYLASCLAPEKTS